MPAEANRPSPEQFLHLIRRQERGRLKVYLGSNAGVGKTYAMLREGNRLKKQGVDVAVGIVETHGRAETAEQIGDLPVKSSPAAEIEYRGVTLREMDLDAILERRPTVCLVDELAHTNAPGQQATASGIRTSRTCSGPGIHVITTVNVQHLESLYDEVERDHRREGQGTPARLGPRRGRPDRQRRRLGRRPPGADEGRQGLPPRPRRAGPGELLHAREPDQAPRADPDRDGPPDRPPEPPGRRPTGRRPRLTERVMVGLSSRSPNAPALLRKAARLADRLNAPWYAVYIQTPAEDLTRTDAATHRILGKNLELAHQLGGLPMTFKGKDVPSTILAFAREYDIRVVVMGKSRLPWYRRLLGPSIIERLLRDSEGLDVMIVDV